MMSSEHNVTCILHSYEIETQSTRILIGWLIDWCLTSSEQFFSYIQDENI
jgi:hypothetical protein